MKEWLDYHSIKTYIVATKMDYVKKSDYKKILNNIEKTMNTKAVPFSVKLPVNSEIYKIFEELI